MICGQGGSSHPQHNFDVKGKQSAKATPVKRFTLMEVDEAKVDLFGHTSVESEVKIEPSEDIKDLVKVEPLDVPTSATVWSFLVKRSRYLHQVEHGRTMDQTKLTKTLLHEMQLLLDEVSRFVRSCCDQHLDEHHEECIAISDQIAQGVLLERGTKLRLSDMPPSEFQEELFSPFNDNREHLVSFLPHHVISHSNLDIKPIEK